jgi:hypothetical protein
MADMQGDSIAGAARISLAAVLMLLLPTVSLHAQPPTPQMNVMYECMTPYSFKFLSCTGSSANDSCDVLSFYAGHPFQHGKSTYLQVQNLLAALPSADAGRSPGGCAQ